MKFAKVMALAAAVTLASGVGFTAAQAASDSAPSKAAAKHTTMTPHHKMMKKSSKMHKKMTTGSSVGTTTGPKSGIQGKAPGAAVSPNSQQANPTKNSK